MSIAERARACEGTCLDPYAAEAVQGFCRVMSVGMFQDLVEGQVMVLVASRLGSYKIGTGQTAILSACST